MSDTVPPTISTDSLWTPQSIVAFYGMSIFAGTVAAVFLFGTPETRSQTVGGVLAIASGIIGFYFGSSSGSQKKDERQAAERANVVAP